MSHIIYWDWVRSEAALIDSDGCTGVSGFSRSAAGSMT